MEYMQKKTAITRDACAAGLQNLKETVKKKMRGDKECLLFYDNVLYASHEKESATYGSVV